VPCGGAIIFRDLVGKIEVLNVEYDKCGRVAAVVATGSPTRGRTATRLVLRRFELRD